LTRGERTTQTRQSSLFCYGLWRAAQSPPTGPSRRRGWMRAGSPTRRRCSGPERGIAQRRSSPDMAEWQSCAIKTIASQPHSTLCGALSIIQKNLKASTPHAAARAAGLTKVHVTDRHLLSYDYMMWQPGCGAGVRFSPDPQPCLTARRDQHHRGAQHKLIDCSERGSGTRCIAPTTFRRAQPLTLRPFPVDSS